MIDVNFIAISMLLLLTTYGSVLLFYKFFGRVGLFIAVPITIILANIQVVMTISVLGFVLTLGNIAYSSSYLISDILNENYSKKDAQKAVLIGLFSMILITVIMNIALLYAPVNDSISLSIYESVKNIFGLLPRIALASVFCYFISQSLDVILFNKIKNKTNSKHLWLRNNMSTVTSQLIDTVLFTTLAFAGVYEFNILIQIFLTTYIVKFIISIFDTPFMYLSVYLHKRKFINEL